MKMRAVIIDDNEIDRLNLSALLQGCAGLTVTGEAATLESAVALVEKERPDVVFLDIYLGRQKGFGVLEKISCKPHVVITTSHPHYAVKGFEIDAVDYLLKPVMEETLMRAMRRLSAHRGVIPGAEQRLVLDDVQLFKQPDGLHVIPVAHILAIIGERIYSRVLVRDGREFLHNRPLREWKELLPEKQFRALDRSTILNISEVKSICTEPGREGCPVSFRNSSLVVFIGDAGLKTLRGFL
jgi:two-component system LytT family response regulator